MGVSDMQEELLQRARTEEWLRVQLLETRKEDSGCCNCAGSLKTGIASYKFCMRHKRQAA